MMQKIMFVVMALLLSLSANVFQYSYFGEKVEALKADKADQAEFYQDVVDRQSKALAMMERQAEVERQVSLENKERLAEIQAATLSTASKLDLLGSQNEDIQSWYDTPVPPDVIQLLNESANTGDGYRSEEPLSAWRIPSSNSNSYLAEYIRQRSNE